VTYNTGNHNYCRNIDGSMRAPWCFTGRNRRELCAVHKCGGELTAISSVLGTINTGAGA